MNEKGYKWVRGVPKWGSSAHPDLNLGEPKLENPIQLDKMAG